MLDQIVGQNVVNQTLPAFGDQWTTYLDKSIAGTGMMGLVILNQPSDPGKASDAMTRLTTGIMRFVESQVHKPGMHIEPRTMKADGLTIHYLPTPIVSPAWVVKGKTLYAGLFPQTVLAAASYNGSSILQNPEFLEMLIEVSDSQPSSFAYVDLPQVLPTAYSQLLMLTQGYANFANLFGLKAPPMILPPLNILSSEVAPMGAALTVDNDGLHYHYRSPFPGSMLIAAMQGNMLQMNTSVMGIDILMPALMSARQAAEQMSHSVKQMSSNAQARNIAINEVIYAQSNNNNHFPPNLATIYRQNLFYAKEVLPPNSDVQVPPGLRKWSEKKQNAWFAKNAGYVMVPGLTNDQNAETIAVFEKPRYAINGKIAVAWEDDHAKSLPVEQVRQMLKKQTGKTMDQLIQASEQGAGASTSSKTPAAPRG